MPEPKMTVEQPIRNKVKIFPPYSLGFSSPGFLHYKIITELLLSPVFLYCSSLNSSCWSKNLSLRRTQSHYCVLQFQFKTIYQIYLAKKPQTLPNPLLRINSYVTSYTPKMTPLFKFCPNIISNVSSGSPKPGNDMNIFMFSQL